METLFLAFRMQAARAALPEIPGKYKSPATNAIPSLNRKRAKYMNLAGDQPMSELRDLQGDVNGGYARRLENLKGQGNAIALRQLRLPR